MRGLAEPRKPPRPFARRPLQRCKRGRAARPTVLVAATIVLVRLAGMPRACGRKMHMPNGSTLCGSYPARGRSIWMGGFHRTERRRQDMGGSSLVLGTQAPSAVKQ